MSSLLFDRAATAEESGAQADQAPAAPGRAPEQTQDASAAETSEQTKKSTPPGSTDSASVESSDTTSTPNADKVLVRIADFTMTLGEFEDLYRRLSPETLEHYQTAGGGGRDAFLQDFVKKKLIALDAERSGIDKRPDVRMSLMVARDTILYEQYARDTLHALLDEKQLRDYYEGHRDEFAVPLRAHVRHIVVTPKSESPISNIDQDDAKDEAAAKAKAEKLRERLAAGESFIALAQHQSEDRTARSGGDLGFVVPGELFGELDKAAFSLEEGELSAVLRSEQGFHILQVQERQEAGILPFDAVREDITDRLSLDVGEKLEQSIETRSAELRKQLAIEVNEKLLELRAKGRNP